MSRELIELAGFPDRVSQLLTGLTNGQVTTKLTAEEFSFAEHVCHLRDIESEGYVVRIRRILSEDNPQLHDIDGARLALERDYNSENVSNSLRTFSDARRESVNLLTGTDHAAMSRTAALEGTGEITLERLVEMMCEHDATHFEEMTSLRWRLLRASAI